MHVFVTGATGYIGAAAVEVLLARGHTVVGLARSDASEATLRRCGADVLRGTLTDGDALRAGARAADAVVHAGFPPADLAHMRDAFDADLTATGVMLDALAGSAKPFVYTSGVGVLGNTGPDEVDERVPPDSPDVGRPRVDAEQLVLAAAARDVRGVVLRPGLVYGRGGSGLVRLLIGLAKQAGRGRTFGDGHNAWSAVHVEDLADLYVLALEHLAVERAPAGTLLNVAAGAPVVMRDLAAAIGRGIGSAAPVEPWPLAEARGTFGVLADGLAGERRVSAARARALLGWAPHRVSLLDDVEHGSYAAALAA